MSTKDIDLLRDEAAAQAIDGFANYKTHWFG